MLLSLASDVILVIVADFDSESDLSRLSRVNRRLYDLLNPLLYRYNQKWSNGSAAMWSAKNGCAGTLSRIIAAGLDVSEPSLLSLAAEYGQNEVIELLLKHGSDPRATLTGGWSPLHKASEQGHAAAVRLLLHHGADAAIPSKEPWHYSSFGDELNDDIDNKEYYVPGVKFTGGVGWLPLHLAASYGHIDAAKELLKAGVDPSVPNQAGWQPLHMAIWNERVGMVDLLLRNGVDGMIPYGRAGSLPPGMTPLHTASSNGFLHIVKLLLAHGVDVNVRDVNGITPLFLAVQRGHEEVVRTLLEGGASTTLQDTQGRTPLFMAYFRGPDHVRFVKLLLDFGASATTASKKGVTPLHLAYFVGDLAAVKLLLDQGADAMATTCSGKVPEQYYKRLQQIRSHTASDSHALDLATRSDAAGDRRENM